MVLLLCRGTGFTLGANGGEGVEAGQSGADAKVYRVLEIHRESRP
jgi:hypothetical protein